MRIGHRILRHYIEGREPVPDEVLLRALDVLLDEGDGGKPKT